MTQEPRVLILPGWLNSGPGHWQSRWQALYGDERVEQADWTWPRRGDWMARLDEVLLADARPAALVPPCHHHGGGGRRRRVWPGGRPGGMNGDPKSCFTLCAIFENSMVIMKTRKQRN